MPPYAHIRPIHPPPRRRLALAALICVAGLAAPLGARQVRAAECSAGAGPAGAAGTSALYGELASTVGAEPLSVDIAARAIGGSCTWVYEVKVLTVSGNVALLDFDLVDLDLMRVEGSPDDPEIARLIDRLNGRAESPDAGDGTPGGSGSDSGSGGTPGGDGPGDSGSGDSGSGDSGSGGDGSGDSDSGSGDSGSGDSGSGDSSGGDSDGGEGGSDGGEGGDSGSGDSGGDSGGGEGGNDD
ncbi:hypothetical protein [Dongia sp.]|uniref:hypothetical protein n=1 Tax=Dongia sp. TaxID=1977262 RepID=UPI0035B1BFBC